MVHLIHCMTLACGGSPVGHGLGDDPTRLWCQPPFFTTEITESTETGMNMVGVWELTRQLKRGLSTARGRFKVFEDRAANLLAVERQDPFGDRGFDIDFPLGLPRVGHDQANRLPAARR